MFHHAEINVNYQYFITYNQTEVKLTERLSWQQHPGSIDNIKSVSVTPEIRFEPDKFLHIRADQAQIVKKSTVRSRETGPYLQNREE